ncbi:hypothetical protein PN499_02910 [Kamptonema animale CS-326]|jgi:hypothetical protein|uniref:hypothetical protein n=1 Tax=Kamptonema animale TaxID=92934 RepID=UPI00232D6409|nr:hypothetical protein [Kamptonema animale]MDB9510159.1 hypothetical protein [Kamptonema animale CS-326]
MINRCVFETKGYSIIFELKSNNLELGVVDLLLEFQLNPHIKDFSIRSIPSYIDLKDLERLATYLETHIASLIQNPDSESEFFVDYGLGFQLQALEGDVDLKNDGEFSIIVLVDVGEYEKGSCHTYVGGLSVVTVEKTQKFISSIYAALTKFSHY